MAPPSPVSGAGPAGRDPWVWVSLAGSAAPPTLSHANSSMAFGATARAVSRGREGAVAPQTDQAANVDWLCSAAPDASTSGYEASDRSGIDQSNKDGECYPNGKDPSGSVWVFPSPLSRTRYALCHQRGATMACIACGLDGCERCAGVLGSSQGRPCDCYDVYLLRNSGGPGGVQATEGVAFGSHCVWEATTLQTGWEVAIAATSRRSRWR